MGGTHFWEPLSYLLYQLLARMGRTHPFLVPARSARHRGVLPFALKRWREKGEAGAEGGGEAKKRLPVPFCASLCAFVSTQQA